MANWTKKLPTKPGYYWERCATNHGSPLPPSILFISEGEDEEDHALVCYETISRGGGTRCYSLGDDEYWDEPIAPPPDASISSVNPEAARVNQALTLLGGLPEGETLCITSNAVDGTIKIHRKNGLEKRF